MSESTTEQVTLVEVEPSQERNEPSAVANVAAATQEAAKRLARWRQRRTNKPRNQTPRAQRQAVVRGPVSIPHLFTGPRIAAMTVWLVGVYTTTQALIGLGVNEGIYATGGAFGLQLIFTIGQRPLWRGTKYSFVGFSFVGFDTFFNFGGVWPLAKNIDKTPSWTSSVEALQMASEPPDIVKVGFAIIVSLLIAGGVEWLWFMEE